MRDHVSRYLEISTREYALEDGQRVRMVYATRTGSVVCLPSAAVDALVAGTLDGLDDDLLTGLREVEAVVSDEAERDTVLHRQRAASADRRQRRYVLLPTSYCNMGCSYCGQQHTRGNLGPRHRDAVAARVLAGIAAPETTTVRVNWFGAEPMVGYPMIRDLSSRFVAAADERGVSYSSAMVTNGSLLTQEKLGVLRHECRITKFDITLDGPARIHDQHRPLKNGGRSFDRITATMAEAVRRPDLADVAFVFRTNIDVANVDWVDEYLDTMAGLGFTTENVTFNLAPVYSWGNDVSAVEIERREYGRREVQWMSRMLDLGLHFSVMPNEPMQVLCAAVSRSIEIHSSSGALFSCSEYPLVPQHEETGGLGRITELPVRSRRPVGPFDDWHDAVAAGETPCHSCRLLPVCGGACPKQWREGNQACPPYKFTIPERFDLIARMHGLTPIDEPEPVPTARPQFTKTPAAAA